MYNMNVLSMFIIVVIEYKYFCIKSQTVHDSREYSKLKR